MAIAIWGAECPWIPGGKKRMTAQRSEFNREAPNWPQEPRALERLERQIEVGNLGELPASALPNIPRYLVTYMNSQTRGPIRSATVVSVTNQSPLINRVWVSYF